VPASFEWKQVALVEFGAGSFTIVLRILLTLSPDYFDKLSVRQSGGRERFSDQGPLTGAERCDEPG